jgi:hypothetical protein
MSALVSLSCASVLDQFRLVALTVQPDWLHTPQCSTVVHCDCSQLSFLDLFVPDHAQDA